MKPEPSESLHTVFAEAYRQLSPRTRTPEINASFYPFAEFTHTIRSRKGVIYARVSDLLHSAPVPVLQAVARMLIARLLKLPVLPADEKLYHRFVERPEMQAVAEASLRERTAPPPADPSGEFYDLDRMFARLNRRYFSGSLPAPSLGWSVQSQARVLGYYDYAHQAIVISRILDDAYVPPYVVEFLLYHEMLHLKHQPDSRKGKRHFHTIAFRADEEKFAHYSEAMAWIDAFVSGGVPRD